MEYNPTEFVKCNNPLPENLLESGKFLMTKDPFYGELFIRCNFISTPSIPTAGVNVSIKGFNFYYNPDWIGNLSFEQTNYLVLHELQHLISNHLERGKEKSDDSELLNVSADMIINSNIEKYYVKRLASIIKRPSENLCLIPDDYDGQWIMEVLYDFLVKNKEENQNNSGNSQGEDGKDQNGNNQNGQKGQKNSDQERGPANGKYGKQIDVHLDNEVTDAIKENMVDEILNEMKMRGMISSEQEIMIDSLRKPTKDYLGMVRSALTDICGSHKDPTWKKMNRKNDFMKGNKQVGNIINVILDTSGSMGESLKKVLSILNRRGITMNLIQIDTEVKGINVIKSPKDLLKIKYKGFGGTTLQPAIDTVSEKWNKYPTVMITDGYTDNLNFSKVSKKVLILTTDVNPPMVGGKVKVLKIEK